MKKNVIAKMVDHTILKANATYAQVDEIVAQAKQYNFASVCINPFHIKRVATALQGTDVQVCTVIGFPLGANSSLVKAFETKQAIQDGATEVDMVINVGALKSGDAKTVKDDIQAVFDAAAGTLVKVIIETCYLTKEEIALVCKLCTEVGVAFVKTSTGFGTGGATAEDVALMKQSISSTMKVKASGGIRDYNGAMEMVLAGAERIGTSAGIAIVEQAE